MDTQPYEIAQWFYVGHYGQLGPLTYDQMVELVQDGVIGRETYVWKNGMTQWEHALTVPDLRTSFAAETFMPPPPPPAFNPGSARPSLATAPSPAPMWSYGDYAIPRSDRNRIVAGVLQLIIPGTGRMYLGYAALGVLQLFLFPFGCGLGWLWSIIDGIVILSGGVKLDGYGRRLPE